MKVFGEWKNAKQIKAFAFDVDGVFTDGGLLCDLSGELFRIFNAKDGFAVRMARMHGYPVAIITGGRSLSIKERFITCGVDPDDIYLGSRNKVEQLDEFCRRHNIKRDEVLYGGDDIPDIETMRVCGLAACPDDAVMEVQDVADVVSEYEGGKGFVRDTIETVMKKQGTWTFDALEYKRKF